MIQEDRTTSLAFASFRSFSACSALRTNILAFNSANFAFFSSSVSGLISLAMK